MITLKDIAKECNVSFSTVSKALKGSSEISEDTIKMIQEKAAAMGYHPNIAARTLRTNRTFDIGVIFEDKTGSGFQHQYFAKIISGFQDIAQKKNYDITFIGSPYDKNYDYYKHIMGRNFDGVAIFSADFTRQDIKALVQSQIPTVTLDYLYDKNHISIISDNQSGMSELVNYVISMGHTKIAMIYGEDTLVTRERKEVFKKITEEHNIHIPDEYFVQSMYHEPIISGQATEMLLSLPNPPTCIFYPDDYSALGGIREINARKMEAGKDISIVGYDGIMLTSMMLPPLTTYEQDGVKIGNLMAEKLIENIEETKKEGPQNDREPILVRGRLLKGGTVKHL